MQKTNYEVPELIEVALADDHLLVRQSLTKILSLRGNIKVIIEASNNEELLAKLSGSKTPVVVLDLFMPDLKSCVNTIKKIHQTQPTPKIIIVTMNNDGSIKSHLLKCGVYAVIHKGADIDLLINTILQASQSSLNPRYHINSKNEFDCLFSEREIKILKLIAAGKTNKEVAEIVFLSVRSIEEIKFCMKEKIDAKNTISLIKFAIENKIV
jgi:DNA-binding NarL/FixJ family response regulator